MFLGHQIGGDVITSSSYNLEKVRKTPRPTTKKQVRSFLGLVGYYRDNIPVFAEISAPLSDLLKKGKSEQVQWNEAQEHAYSLLKENLLQEPVLKLPEVPNHRERVPGSSVGYWTFQTLSSWQEIHTPDRS